MFSCTIPCFVEANRLEEIKAQLLDYSEQISSYCFQIDISHFPTDKSENALIETTIHLHVDDEKIQAMKGAKRGPKFKNTIISVEEMVALKKEGVPPEEIARLAGIGVATYFRRMAAYNKENDEN